MKKGIFKKEDRGFYLSVVLCLLFFAIVFINSKILDDFKKLGILSWIIIPVSIYCCGLALSFFLNVCTILTKVLIKGLKKAITEKNYMNLIGLMIQTTIIIFVIFPFLKMILLLVANSIFGIKTNN